MVRLFTLNKTVELLIGCECVSFLEILESWGWIVSSLAQIFD